MQTDKFRKAAVFFKDKQAGIIEEIEGGYIFTYDSVFVAQNQPLSVSLPLKQKVYEGKDIFPFFLGLLPEGWYLDVVSKTLKIDKKDNFSLLLATCQDTSGAVAIEEIA